MRTVAAVFPSIQEASIVVRDLERLGIGDDDVIVATETKRPASAGRSIMAAAASGFGWFFAAYIPVIESKSTPLAAAGIGALMGGAGFYVLGLILLSIPGIEPFVAGSAALTLLTMLAFGAAAAGLAAAVFAMGVSHENDAFTAEAVREHGVVVAAHVSDPVEPQAVRVMNEHGARSLREYDDPLYASDSSGRSHADGNFPSGWGPKA
jgi:hypothetical protein